MLFVGKFATYLSIYFVIITSSDRRGDVMIIKVLDKEDTGKNIKRICDAKKIRPHILKKYLALNSVQSIYKWYEGVNIPSVDNLVMLAYVLDKNIEDLIVTKEINI